MNLIIAHGEGNVQQTGYRLQHARASDGSRAFFGDQGCGGHDAKGCLLRNGSGRP